MDRRSFISAITLSAIVAAVWLFFDWRYTKNHPELTRTDTTATTQPADAVVPDTQPATTNPTTAQAGVPTSGPTMAPILSVAPTTQPTAGEVILGSDTSSDPTYAMQLVLTPNGASVASVTLNAFPAPDTGSKPKGPKPPYRFQTTVADNASTRVLGTRKLVIDGNAVDLWDVAWVHEPSAADSAKFSVILMDRDARPLVKVTKTFTIQTRTATKDKSDGYEIAVAQTIENLQPGRPIKVHSVLNGPTPPPGEAERGTDRMLVAGYSDSKEVSVVQTPFTDFKSDNPTRTLTVDKNQLRFQWFGQASGYFEAIVLPEAGAQSTLDVRAEAQNFGEDEERNALITLETSDITLTDKPATLALSVYLGPKWRNVIGNNYYSVFPREYNKTVGMTSGLCGWCTRPELITSLVWVLGVFHAMFKDWGLAIIGLVLLVRLCLHPITKRSQVQMMKMGKLGPEVEKLKIKYKDQPDVLNREMMQLYKQQGGAILGCLPMFLQTPIWIALWSALQGTFELRQAPFLGHFTWIHDLAKPDRLFVFSQPIPLFLFGWHMSAINILPIMMAVMTYINQRYFMPMPLAATPEQESQQKIQRRMSLFFPLMFYSLPSGLNLYYLTSMSLGVLESKIIRDHIKKQEELAKKNGPEILSVKPTRGNRGGGGAIQPTKPPSGPSGLMAKFLEAMQKAQEQAEQMRNDSNKGKGKGK